MTEINRARDAQTFRITLLGTGSPSPNLDRHHPAALVEWGETGHMLVDAGDGVVSQLLAAQRSLATIENIALTHMHWDHILGYPAFVWGSWTVGRQALNVIGPAGTKAMHHQLVESYYRDQAEWAIDLGYARAGFDDVLVRDVDVGWSTEIDGCRIDAGPVYHPPMDAVAYRFTYDGRSVVVSGDTAESDDFVAFSRGVDVMVVDACAFVPPGDLPPARRRILERLHEFHATPQQCIDMAVAAAASTVVLTHHLPGVTPEFDASAFDGRVVIGADLEVIDI